MTATRLTWYNPKLDPAVAHKLTEKMLQAIEEGTYDDGSEKMSGPLNVPDIWHEANLVSSLCADGRHRPALDIDLPFAGATVETIASAMKNDYGLDGIVVQRSAGGNCHVYADGPALTWGLYVRLLEMLVDAGWVEDKYRDHSLVRGQTLLRLPGIPKMWSRP